MNRVLVVFILASFMLIGCDKKAVPTSADLAKLTPDQQAALEKASNDPMFTDTDLGLWVRGKSIVQIINSINTIPAERRLVTIQVTEELDHLVDEADYYVDLYDLEKNNAVGSIESIEAIWSNDGVLEFSTDLRVQGNARIHGHYKPLKVGAHAGFGLGAKTRLKGQVSFVKSNDPKRLFEANFELLPAPLQMNLSTSIKDRKEWCWQMDLPFGGEAKDCKTLWQYNIPINISQTFNVRTDKAVSLPLEVNLPKSIRLQKEVGGIKFNKSISISIEPKDFRADAVGLALRVGVKVAEVPTITDAQAAK